MLDVLVYVCEVGCVWVCGMCVCEMGVCMGFVCGVCVCKVCEVCVGGV